ncbi:polyprotein [Chestnut mosaic virus]|uniref:RNA-directed DNA polymerase n=56 Tax=Chestnut mosaic virus TaxID=2781948 RepID=A0AAE7TDJ8_9VIRU|nr:polyprotein [Chestnut mosaic virus]QOS14285.1 polyprotein [Chestnut mosaic virus]
MGSRTQTIVQDPPVLVLRQNEEGSSALQPTFEDQLRNYKTWNRIKYEVARRVPLLRSKNTKALEQRLDPDMELKMARKRRAAIVPAETLYESNMTEARNQVYQHYSEQPLLVTSNQVDLNFIQEESYQVLARSNYQMIHLGMAMVMITALHRKHAGTKACVFFRDTRWDNGKQSGLGTIEIDLSQGSQMVYIIPDFTLSIHDFYHYFQVCVMTRGYEDFKAGDSNLLITRAFVGRVSNENVINFRYRVQGALDYLTNKGMRVIPAKEMGTDHLKGGEWRAQPSSIRPALQAPTGYNIKDNVDGSVSLRFHTYEDLEEKFPEEDEEDGGAEPLRRPPRVNISAAIFQEEEPEDEREPPPTWYIGQPISVISEGLDDYWQESQDPVWDKQPVDNLDYPLVGEPVFDKTETETDEKWVNPFSFPEGSGRMIVEDRAAAIVEEKSMKEMDFQDLIKMGQQMEKEAGKLETAYSTISGESSGGNHVPLYTPATNQDSGIHGGVNLDGARFPRNYRIPHKPVWHLPLAGSKEGLMLILPEDIEMYDDVISRWEVAVINFANGLAWDSNRDKVEAIVNMLGTTERQIFEGWKRAFENDYANLIETASETRNITSCIRVMITGEDAYQGQTMEQNRAYLDIERLTCKDMADVFSYMNQYLKLAAKTGRMWMNMELSDKFFRKLPPVIGPAIEESFKRKYPTIGINVTLRIYYTYHYLAEMCKQAAIQRSLKDLTFCRKVTIPGYFKEQEKKYGLRRAKTFKGKPHTTHIRVFKSKDGGKQRKCTCYICGEEGHFARECSRKKGDINRAAYVDNLNLPENWDVLSVSQGESDSSAICSMSEGEQGCNAGVVINSRMPYDEEFMFVIIQGEVAARPANDWIIKIPLLEEMERCEHKWEEGGNYKGLLSNKGCYHCRNQTESLSRIICLECKLMICLRCAKMHYGISVKREESARSKEYMNKDQLIKSLYDHNIFLLKENERLKEQLEELRIRYNKNMELDKTQLEEERRRMEEGDEERAGALFLEELAGSDVVGRTHINRLYNVLVTFKIPRQKENDYCEFTITAILDTGCTTCCINKSKVPEEAMEDAKVPSHFHGVNSTQIARKRIKEGKMYLGEQYFKTPYIYCFEMKLPGVDMLIGCNFIRAMQGGLRIEGSQLTFYRNVTSIETSMAPHKVAGLLQIEEEEQLQIMNWMYAATEADQAQKEIDERFRAWYKPIIKELERQGYIGEEPLKHWQKNGIKCKLDIINPDITIESKPFGKIPPAMEDQYRRHIDALLKIGVIRPSKSRHRTKAMIVNSGTSIDPKTGKEVRGKERMVLDYRALNMNTHKDQYSLPGITSIIKRVAGSKVFSKFDLKSGFHQVVMEEESIPWTAFVVPGGLYEWLVMPFGLRNAPSTFQRKMDQCFRGTEEFISVYIDDILVFSPDLETHAKHLEKMLAICKDNGLVLSPTKMKVAVKEVDFLGATIRDRKVKLQPHIVKKISEVREEDLKTLKGLRSWLGVINYARAHIPKCGTLLGPLYQKVGNHGDKRWTNSDLKLVKQIKELVQQLPDLEIPPEGSYIILETDGCMEGWGGVCKWAPFKGAKKSEEKVCAYASGKFPTLKSTIDAEIYAVMETMESLKIYYLDQKAITVRTDCQAIIAFHDKQLHKKPSRVRWINFCDYITGTGVEVKFEHIKGENNQLADHLSRLTTLTAFTICQQEDHPGKYTIKMKEVLSSTLIALHGKDQKHHQAPSSDITEPQYTLMKPPFGITQILSGNQSGSVPKKTSHQQSNTEESLPSTLKLSWKEDKLPGSKNVKPSMNFSSMQKVFHNKLPPLNGSYARKETLPTGIPPRITGTVTSAQGYSSGKKEWPTLSPTSIK